MKGEAGPLVQDVAINGAGFGYSGLPHAATGASRLSLRICGAREAHLIRRFDAWYDAFGIKQGDPLYIAPEDRVRIW